MPSKEVWEEVALALGKSNSGQNDRLAVELLKLGPVPTPFFSKWVPAEPFLKALQKAEQPLRYQQQILERLAQESAQSTLLTVAESLLTPLPVIEKLAGDIDAAIRLTAQHHPNCPPPLVELLEGQQAIAADLTTDAEQLAALAQNYWPVIRLTVAQNPSAPESVLLGLVDDGQQQIRRAIARNPTATAAVLTQLVETNPNDLEHLAADIAVHLNAPDELLKVILSSTHGRWLRNVILKRNPLSESVLRWILAQAEQQSRLPLWKNRDLHSALTNNPATPEWVLMKIAQCNVAEIRAELEAKHPDRESEQIERWLQEKLCSHLRAVAKHPNAAADLLAQIAQYGNSDLNFEIAYNPQAPEDLRNQIFEQILAEPSDRQLHNMSSNPQTPVPVLEQIARKSSGIEPGLLAIQTILKGQASADLIGAIQAFFDTHYDSAEQVLFWLRQDPAFREPIVEDWAAMRSQLAETDRQMLDAASQSFLPMIGLSGGLSGRDRWMANRPEALNLYGFLMLFQVTSPTGGTRQHRSVLMNLVQNPTVPMTLRKEIAQQLSTSEKPVSPSQASAPETSSHSAAKDSPTNAASVVLNDYLQKLSVEADEQRQKAETTLAGRPNNPYAIKFAPASNNFKAKMTAARSRQTPPDVLAQLAQDTADLRRVVAQNPGLEEDVLLKLAQDQDSGVRLAIAQSDRQLSPFVLQSLMATKDTKVLAAIAQSSDTPSHILDSLASHASKDIRIKALANPAAPATALTRELPTIQNEKLLDRVLRGPRNSRHSLNPHMPPELLERFSTHPASVIRYLVSRYPNANASTLTRLSSDESDLVRNTVAENPSTPWNVLIEMAKREKLATGTGSFHTVAAKISMRKDAPPEALDWVTRQPISSVRKMAVANANVSAETLTRLAKTETDEPVLLGIVRHPNVSEAVLAELAERGSVAVREAIAALPNCPPQILILELLTQTPSEAVCIKIAANPNTPPNYIDLFVTSEKSSLRVAAASNPSLSAEQIAQLAADNKIEVKRAVASNPSASSEIRRSLRSLFSAVQTTHSDKPLSPTLQSLPRLFDPETDSLPDLLADYFQSENEFVRLMVLLNPQTPFSILESGARSPAWFERYAVAENDAISTELCQQLAQDEQKAVSATAQSNLR